MLKRYILPLFLLAGICLAALLIENKVPSFFTAAQYSERQIIILDAGHEGLANTINWV